MAWYPQPDKDGLRRYNKWAGNPDGDKEDATRCVVNVYSSIGRGMLSHQCNRKRGHGPDGLFCKQHAKMQT